MTSRSAAGKRLSRSLLGRRGSLLGLCLLAALGCQADRTDTKAAAPSASAMAKPTKHSDQKQPAEVELPPEELAASCQRRGSHALPKALPDARRISSSIALARVQDRTIAYVADSDADELRVVDLDNEKELVSAKLGGEPSQLLVAKDGRVYVAMRDRSELAVFEPGSAPKDKLTRLCRVQTAAEPVALAESPDGKTLAVSSRWERTLALLDAAHERLKSHVAVTLARDPYAVAIADDGRTAYVSHVVGGRVSVVDLPASYQPLSGDPQDVKVRRGKLRSRERRSLGSSERVVERRANQGFGLALSDEGEVFAPGVLVEPGDTTESLVSSGYGFSSREHPVMESLVFALRPNSKKLRTTASGCALPSAVAFEKGRNVVHVACLGSTHSTATNSLARGDDDDRVNERHPVGEGVSGLAVDSASGMLAAWSQFEQKLTLNPLGTASAETKRMLRRQRADHEVLTVTISLPRRGQPDADIALGRRIFHETSGTRIAHDGRACASCHPSGRDDGLTWATPDGPRQTPILAGRLQGTAPYGWNGGKPGLHGHLRRTLRRLGGSGLTGQERDALFAYINSLQPPRRRDSRAAQQVKGEQLFLDPASGCSGCHVGGRNADGVRHDVGSVAKGDDSDEFDTPSLRWISQSAPYFHDGRYPTLLAMLSDAHMKMGNVAQMSKDDRLALVSYLNTL